MPKKVKEESKEKLKKILIPKDEISFDFFRSCGPGGGKM
jgi:protein subunit release factor B